MARIRQIVPALMSACLASSVVGAVSNSSQAVRGVWVIQYSDLPELVRTYSPQAQMERTLYETRLGRYESAREEMVGTRRHLREETEGTEKNRNSDGANNYRTQAKVPEEAAKDMDKQIRSAEGSSSTTSLHRMEDTTVWTAQGSMGTHHSLRVKQEGALAEVKLIRRKYEKAMHQAGLGIVSQIAADEAEKAVAVATNKTQSSQNDTERVRKELLMTTGYSEDSQIQVGMLPAPSQSRVDGVTLETDRQRVFGNGYELGQQRGSSSGGTIKEYHVHQWTIEEGEATMHGQMDTLYQGILAGRTVWQSVATVRAAREAEWKAVFSKVDLGMPFRQEHLEAKSSYLGGAAAKAQADVNFQQTVDMYNWAVRGLMATN